jgi:flavin-dependent dehydrogenase
VCAADDPAATPDEVDVLVVGGTVKGVAAATAAKQAGAKNVYLVTPFPYLGEDMAGTLELGLPPGEKPTLPLVRKLWSGTAGLAAFDYTPDRRSPHPRWGFHNDWWERLSEPGMPAGPTDGVYYEGDVSYACELRKTSKIARIEVLVFEKKGRKKAKSPREGGAATGAVTCRVLDGPLKGRTIGLTRKGKAGDVVGDSPSLGVDAISWQAVLDAELREVEIKVAKAPDAQQQYVARIWFHLADAEKISEPPSPLKVKRILDRELVDAGVGFLTGTAVRDVFRTDRGEIAGVGIVNRSGRHVIRAKRTVDATRYGALADFGKGLPVAGGGAEFSRVVIAEGKAPSAPGMKVEPFGDAFRISHPDITGRMYRCTLQLPMKDGTYPSFAAAEWEAREKTWVDGMLDDADLLVWRTAAWKELETRIREGEALGRAAANAPAVGPAAFSPLSRLPFWGEFDVVVVGGGTSGSPAAIAAARAGAKVLLVEYLQVLGGVGTDGMILGYYDGNHCGFTEEFKKANREIGGKHSLYRRAETWRRKCREAGVTVWLGAMGTGAVVENGKVVGAEVATTLGCGAVCAKCFVDATGNADLAAAAGAKTEFLSAAEFALQSAGQAPHRLGRGTINSDFGYVNDSSAYDLWLFGLRARAGAPNAWDLAKMPDSRERRRIVPDYAVNAQDVTARRPFPDVVVQSRSRQDSHGYLTDDFRFLSEPSATLVKLKRETGLSAKFDVNVPLRSLLPKGLSGIAVVGIGTGCARDVLPMIRMQADLMNMGYAVGTAAAMAARHGGEFRSMDFAALRKRLVELKILRPETLSWEKDVDVTSDAVLAAAVKTMGRDFTGTHVVYRPENRVRALPLLREAFSAAGTDVEKQNYAVMLGFLGDATGAEVLAEIVSGKRKIIAFDRAGAFGGGGHSKVGYMIALGRTKSKGALTPLLQTLSGVNPGVPVLAVRGPTLALEALGDPGAAPALAEKLKAFGSHAVEKATDLPPLGGYGLGPEMGHCIKELAFARALWACGDHEGLARKTLEAYARDPRGVLAAHAKAVLASRR